MAQTDVVRLRGTGVAVARQSALINLLIDMRQKRKWEEQDKANKVVRILGDKPSLS